jgi:hypothetical protein
LGQYSGINALNGVDALCLSPGFVAVLPLKFIFALAMLLLLAAAAVATKPNVMFILAG